MTNKKILLFSLISFLVIGIFSCQVPGDNQGGVGPNTGGGGNQGPNYPGGPGYPGGTGGGGQGGNFNSPPWVNINTPNLQVQTNQQVNLTANAGDNENDPLNFEWGCNNGFFNGPMNANQATWMSPNFNTGAKIWVKVRDGRGGEAYAEVFIGVGSAPNAGGPNSPPVFTDVHSDFTQVGPGGKVRLFATAYDPDYDPISYHWRMINEGGFFSNPGRDSQSCDWTSPAIPSGPVSYEFVCEANDGKGGVKESMHIWVYMNYGGAGGNQPPNSFIISASPMNGVVPDGIVNLTASASDPDNDPLSYSWSASSDSPGQLPGIIGVFMPSPTGTVLTWKAPHINASQVNGRLQVWFTINCSLDDMHAHIDNRMISIEVLTDTTK